MKKCWLVLVFVLILSGCSAPKFETVSDVGLEPVSAQPKQLSLTLPKDAAAQTVQSDASEKIYLCDGYTLTTHTMPGGDLEATVYQLTGFDPQQLTLMQTRDNGCKQYEAVWSAAGEGGDQVGRFLILDDGGYHYAVTVMAPAAISGTLRETWADIFDSVTIDTD